jgi:hypothetical protein
MNDTPKGYHDAEVWLQVQGKTRLPWYQEKRDGAGEVVVDSIKVAAMTQSRPSPPRRGCIAVKVTLRIPDGAFLPFSPEAVITVPENMVVRGPIEADVAGDEIPHEFESAEGSSGMVCTALVADRDGFGTDCGMPAVDPIHHTKD